MKNYARIAPSFRSNADSEKRSSVQLETADENQVSAIAMRLKKYCCERFIFGERSVFGRKEVSDGSYLEKDCDVYSWPARKVHNLSRDPHPDLEERYNVPDDKVCWASCRDEDFESYRPEFATEGDRNEALRTILEKRKLEEKDFSSLAKKTLQQLNANRILECHDMSLELQITSCRPSFVQRNPCGRYGMRKFTI